jgi:hypothetical protein
VATGGERSNTRDRSGGPTGGNAGRPGPATLGLDALLEVQRRGLHAAGELVDRLVRAVDGPDADPHGDGAPADAARRAGPDGRTAPTGPGPAAGPGGDASHDRQDAGGEALDQIARAWADWVRRGLSVFDGAAGGDPPAASPGGTPTAGSPAGAPGPAPGSDVALDAEGAIGVVRLVARPDHPAGAASPVGPVAGSAEVWLHNRGAVDRTAVALHGGPLLGSDGAMLPADAVHLDPAVVDLPARSSRGITVTVRSEAAPGTYRGVVVASGAPEAWIAVEVAVTDRDRGDGDGDDGR